MKKKVLLMTACLFCTIHAMSSDVLTVENVTLPQNTETTIAINCEFDTQFKGYQLDVELDGGLSLVLDEDEKPVGENGFTGTDHSITASQVAEGKYRFIVVSFGGKLLPTSGTLLKIKVTGAAEKEIGESFNGRITATEFTTTSNEIRNLSDVNFTITIGEPAFLGIVLDENSTTAPVSATGVDVKVKRTIKANEWSTICLPFAMTTEQVKDAFGSDVEVNDFTNWSSEENDEGDIVSITIGFTSVSSIEANHPYVIKVSSPITEFTVNGVDITPEEEPTKQVGTKKANRGYFTGAYVAETVIPEENVFLSGNKFYYSNGSTKMKAFRGYFEFADVLTDMNASSRSINFNDETTSVQKIDVNVQKVDVFYDLSGRRVKNPSKGIFIVNGMKVMIK